MCENKEKRPNVWQINKYVVILHPHFMAYGQISNFYIYNLKQKTNDYRTGKRRREH